MSSLFVFSTESILFDKNLISFITPTEKKNETKQNLFIYSITMFYTLEDLKWDNFK
jgi:hypothetical protein